MWLAYTLSFIAASSAITSATSVCTASQCLDGNGDAAASVSGSLISSSSSSNSTILLLPGQYSPSSTPNVVSLLASGQSTVSLPTYLGSSASPTGVISGLPFTIETRPGLVVFPSASFQGQPIVVSLNLTNNETQSRRTITAGSLLVSPNAYAVFSGSNSKPVIIYDVSPDVGQLPAGLLNTQNGQATLIEVQSTTCSTPCASSGQCNSNGTCICKPGFTGSACETCAPGFYGPQCLACPAGCTACDDGNGGSGKCLSPISSIAPSTCDCENGTCAGSGNSTCTCVPGWTSVALSTSITPATNGSSTQCSSCANGFFKNTSNDCRACTLNCASCAAPSGTCTQCRQGFVVSTSDPAQCVASATSVTCPDGSYALGDGTCGPCSPLCNTCTGPTGSECLVCGSGFSNLNGVCTAVDVSGVCTGTGLVANNAKRRCDACPNKCSACNIPAFNVGSPFESIQCTACLPGYVLSRGRCTSQCPVGQFVGADGVTCQQCDPSCATCVGGSNFCLTCSQSGQFALDGVCTTSCPASTFSLATAVTSSSNTTTSATSSTTGNTCSPCHPDCATCSGPRFDQCGACPVDRPVKTASGRCLQTCGRSQFWDDVSGSCQQCNGGCATCAAGGANQCLSCPSTMVLQGGQCVASSCSNGTVASLGGICLSSLVGSSPVVVESSSSSPVQPSAIRKIWPFILVAAILLLLSLAGLVLWRWRARRRRAAETKVFKERLQRDGIATGRPARLSAWAWGKVFGRREQDPAEERRHRLREQLRYSKRPEDGLDADVDMVEVDLEGREQTGRVAAWRSRISSMSPTLSKSRSPFARLSGVTTLTDDSNSGPEQPVGWARPTFRTAPSESGLLSVPVTSRQAPSTVDTSSVYSNTNSRLDGRVPTIPTPRQPLKGSDYGGSAQVPSPSIRYPSSRSTAGLSALAQFQPLIGAAPRPPLPYTAEGGSTTGGSWQTPMMTGSSAGVSTTASKLGDKNPFRQRL